MIARRPRRLGQLRRTRATRQLRGLGAGLVSPSLGGPLMFALLLGGVGLWAAWFVSTHPAR